MYEFFSYVLDIKTESTDFYINKAEMKNTLIMAFELDTSLCLHH